MNSRQVVATLFGGFIILIAKTSGELRRIIPPVLEIREGEDMQLRLSMILSDKISCYVRTPWLESINLKIEEEEDQRIKYWSENNTCGVQVKNVLKKDQGWWRLTSKNSSNQTLVDAVNVTVLEKVDSIQNQYQIRSGLGYSLLLSPESKFCTVNRPNTEEIIEVVQKDCLVDLDAPTEADAGNWTAKVGVKGKIEEMKATAKLAVYQEQIVSGYKKSDSKYLYLYCNLLNYDDVPDLCRFSQPERYQSAFILSEGLHKGRYGYYGNGLTKGECGLTIEDPKPEDFVTWNCRVGKVGKRIFGDYIRLPSSLRKTEDTVFQSVSPVITTISKELILQCSVNIPLKYCWFSGPNRTILTPIEFSDLNDNFLTDSTISQSYSYFGKGLDSGECGVNIKSAEEIHNGTWTCHMGPNSPGLDITADIEVRISETPLAAINKVVFAENIRDTVSIKCEAVPKRVALHYCRFYSPCGIGIHINEEITEENPLVIGDRKIWFNGKSTKLGDCGITFKGISSNDIGTWRCAARLEAVKLLNEAFDTIEIILKEQKKSENPTAAASTGIAAGVMVVLGLIVVIIIYLNKNFKATWILYRTRPLPSAEETPRETFGNIVLNPISRRSSQTTSGSNQ